MGIVSVMLLMGLLVLGLYMLIYGLRWLWRTATGQVTEVDGEVVTTGWRAKLPAVALALFVVLGVLLVIDRLIHPTDPHIRRYQPASLEADGRIVPGKTY